MSCRALTLLQRLSPVLTTDHARPVLPAAGLPDKLSRQNEEESLVHHLTLLGSIVAVQFANMISRVSALNFG